MEDKNLLQKEKEKEALENNNKEKFDFNIDDEKDSCRIRIFGWSPNWLQYFNTINWFTAVLCLASTTQGIIVNGLSVVSLPTIEKEFGISSKSAGLIVAGNDASALILVGLVSFFGSKAHKPRWMGLGVLVTGLGGFLYAAPKLMVGNYDPPGQSGVSFDMCNPNKPVAGMTCTSSGSKLHVAVLFIAQFIMGGGVTPLYTLGPAYLDENVTPKASPIYLGIWFASTMLGPGLGFLIAGQFLKIFTDIEQPDGLSMKPSDPRWIGAWWLGFVCLSIFFFVSGSLLLLYPKHLPKAQEKRRKAISQGHIPKSDTSVEYTIIGYIKASVNMIFNKVFMLAVFAITIKMLYAVGLATFLVKVLVVKFGIAPHKSSMILGAIMVPTMLFGILGGALLMRRAKVEFAAKTAAKICLAMSLITLPFTFIFLIPGCNNTNIAGTKVAYSNTSLSSKPNPYSQCNSDCLCSKYVYIPVCGSDDVTYQSPCFAGCNVTLMGDDKLPYFGNCSCIRTWTPKDRKRIAERKTALPGLDLSNIMRAKMKASNMTLRQMKMRMEYAARSLYNKATLGVCDRGCKNFIIFVIVIMIMIVFSFFSGTPHKMVVLRSVPDNQRSFALGVQFLIMRSISFLPGPIIMGAVVDSQCISWTYTSCGERKNCADYDVDGLSRNLVMFSMITSAVAALCYATAIFVFPKKDEDGKGSQTLVFEEMKDDTAEEKQATL